MNATDKNTFKEQFRKRIKDYILKLIGFIDSLPNDKTCSVISKQLMRSGTSIGANYFEAKAASSINDFINYFNHSLKSANESIFWIELLIDTKKCNIQEAKILLNETTELSKILASSIISMKKNNDLL